MWWKTCQVGETSIPVSKMRRNKRGECRIIACEGKASPVKVKPRKRGLLIQASHFDE